MYKPTCPGDCIRSIGRVGRRLSEIRACDGAAGNISVYMAGFAEPPDGMTVAEAVELPAAAPALVGGLVLATGSGCPLREIADDPLACLGAIAVQAGGAAATLYTSSHRRFERLTVELNTHLAVHQDQAERGAGYQAVIHAQPTYLTYLSHVDAFAASRDYSRAVLRWQPESIYHLREGIDVVPFQVPASVELQAATVHAMRGTHMVVWRKHGVLSRSEQSLDHALELIEYAESGARLAYLNLAAGGLASGLTDDEVLQVCNAFALQQELF